MRQKNVPGRRLTKVEKLGSFHEIFSCSYRFYLFIHKNAYVTQSQKCIFSPFSPKILQIEQPCFDSRDNQEIFFSKFQYLFWNPLSVLFNLKPGALSQKGREGDRSFPSSAEIKNEWSYTSTPPYAFLTCTENT